MKICLGDIEINHVELALPNYREIFNRHLAIGNRQFDRENPPWHKE
jgi:hypothetical protein